MEVGVYGTATGAAAMVLGLVLVGCSSAAAVATIELRAAAFEPENVTVAAGAAVRWSNIDGFDHTVTAGAPDAPAEGVFRSELAAGDTFQRTFDEAGAFPYFCEIHPVNMTGTVTVR